MIGRRIFVVMVYADAAALFQWKSTWSMLWFMCFHRRNKEFLCSQAHLTMAIVIWSWCVHYRQHNLNIHDNHGFWICEYWWTMYCSMHRFEDFLRFLCVFLIFQRKCTFKCVWLRTHAISTASLNSSIFATRSSTIAANSINKYTVIQNNLIYL